MAARVRVPGAVVCAWWRVRLPLEVGFLGFGHDMLWSASVLLVSLGKAWICADLILSHSLLGLLDFDIAQSHGGCEMSWSLDPTGKHV